MRPLKPFTTSRRFALCPNCDKAFDPCSQYEYAALPDDCDGVVERKVCSDCTWKEAPQLKPVALVVLAMILFAVGGLGCILFWLGNQF
jgi:hypothetical protein